MRGNFDPHARNIRGEDCSAMEARPTHAPNTASRLATLLRQDGESCSHQSRSNGPAVLKWNVKSFESPLVVFSSTIVTKFTQSPTFSRADRPGFSQPRVAVNHVHSATNGKCCACKGNAVAHGRTAQSNSRLPISARKGRELICLYAIWRCDRTCMPWIRKALWTTLSHSVSKSTHRVGQRR